MRSIKFISIAAFVLTSCSGGTNEESIQPSSPEVNEVSFTQAQIKTAGITIGSMKETDMHADLKVSGSIDVPPQFIISVSFPLGGYLKSTSLLPGMHIRKGQVIAIMEDPSLVQLQQDYLIAQSKLLFLKQEFDRQQILSDNKVSAAKIFQQASAEYLSQKILVKGLSEKLQIIGINPLKLSENTISRSVPVYAPINGFVSKVNVNIGKYVNPSDVLFELINPSDIHAAFTVFEKDMAKVAIGQKVNISLASDPGVIYQGEVMLVTQNVDENRTGVLHCHFKQQNAKLKPGMFINGTIQLGTTRVWALPEDAVVRMGAKEYIFEALSPTNYKMLEVETGKKDAGLVEIMNATSWSDKSFVTVNAYAVLSKLKNTGEE